jgi:hypothetical protein
LVLISSKRDLATFPNKNTVTIEGGGGNYLVCNFTTSAYQQFTMRNMKWRRVTSWSFTNSVHFKSVKYICRI